MKYLALAFTNEIDIIPEAYKLAKMCNTNVMAIDTKYKLFISYNKDLDKYREEDIYPCDTALADQIISKGTLIIVYNSENKSIYDILSEYKINPVSMATTNYSIKFNGDERMIKIVEEDYYV